MKFSIICEAHNLFIKNNALFLYVLYCFQIWRGSAPLLQLNTLLNQSQERTDERGGTTRPVNHTHITVRCRDAGWDSVLLTASLHRRMFTYSWDTVVFRIFPAFSVTGGLIRTTHYPQPRLNDQAVLRWTRRSCWTRARRHVIVS